MLGIALLVVVLGSPPRGDYKGRRQATAEGKLVEAATGRLLAHGTTTCLVIER